MDGSYLSADIFKQLMTPQVKVSEGKYFGLGFVIYDLGGEKIALSHGGGDKGVQTLFVLIPSEKSGVVIFTNVDDGYKIYEKLLTHYLGADGKRIFQIESN